MLWYVESSLLIDLNTAKIRHAYEHPANITYLVVNSNYFYYICVIVVAGVYEKSKKKEVR
jgi:hypothetical protein